MPFGRPSSRFVLSALLGALVLQLSAGCGQQGEGQRCSTSNLNRDCSAGLVCVSPEKLRNGGDDIPRCCPESGSAITACLRGSNSTNGLGDGGAGGQGGQSSLAGSSNLGGATGSPLGSSCNYNSDCAEKLVCGPQGLCQFECKTDRDCSGGKTCSNDNVCE